MSTPPSNPDDPTPSSGNWEEVSAAAPCPACGAVAGCRLGHSAVACLHRGGPLAKVEVGRRTGRTYHAHPRDAATGRLFEPVPDAVGRFLAALFAPTDVVLVRPIETWTEGGRKRSRVVYPAVGYPTAERLATDYRRWTQLLGMAQAERANLFFGVCPRFGPHHFDLAWQVRTVRVLWADLDRCTVEDAARRCAENGLPEPTVTVRSGHGVHLYWRLAEPVAIDAPDPPAVYKEFVDPVAGRKKKVRPYVLDPATQARVYDFPAALDPTAVRVQEVLAGMAAAIGGDHTQDLARMLRLPGTLNRKDERTGQPPVPCELVACEPDRRYPFADFEPFRERRKATASAATTIRLPTGRALTVTRRNRLADLLNVCAVAAVGGRSEADFAVCAWAVENGIDPEAVWSEAKDVGKFAEQGRDYFDRTWRKAEEKAREKAYARACRRAGSELASACQTPPGLPEPGEPTAGDTGSALPAANEEPDDPHRLARTFRRTPPHPDGDTWRFYRDEFWEWTGHRWQSVADAEIKCRVAAFCKQSLDEENRRAAGESSDGEPPTVPKVTRELVSNVLQALGGMVLIARDVPQPCWLDDGGPPVTRPYLTLANGLLDVEAFLAGQSDVLRPHSPRWFSPVGLPYPFDPEADCPTWRAVLARNLGDDPGKARLLQQWAGYLLLPDTSQQRFLMMTGEGANGKSVVCAVLRALLGERNVSSVGLELFGDKFHLAETLGKLANVVSEVGELDRIAEGQLKAFVAGDAMLFERKFKQPFTAGRHWR